MRFGEARDFLLAHREDYGAAYAGFRWPDEPAFNWALDWFDARLAADPGTRDRPALRIVDPATGGETSVTFAEMARRSDRAANLLRDAGIRRGDRLLLLLGNVAPLWELMLAAMKLGAVVIPATTLLTPAEIADRVVRGRVRAVAAAAELAPRLAAHLDLVRIAVGGDAAPEGWLPYDLAAFPETFAPDGPTRADDPLLLYFTSGTTARPKLVLHTHRSYPAGALSTMYWIGLVPGDVHLNVSSPGWAKHAWSCLFAPWNAGATVFLVEQPRFRAATLLDALVQHEVTTLCAPPTVWRLLVQEDLGRWRPRALRELVGAGEPLNPEVIERVRAAWGITIRDGYGQTETTAQVGNPPGCQVTLGAMGRPLPGYRVEVLDAEGREAEEGEVCLRLGADRPAGLMAGYVEEDGGLAGADGPVYRTGDVAMRAADGTLTFVGRADDVFKSSDYRISPFELESALIEHPAVAEAAVVPAPDALRLAVPKAFVTLAAGHEPSRELALALFRHVRAELSPFKRVRRLEMVPELPKTISGKIRRVQLRHLERTGDAGGWPRGEAFAEEDFPELREG